MVLRENCRERAAVLGRLEGPGPDAPGRSPGNFSSQPAVVPGAVHSHRQCGRGGICMQREWVTMRGMEGRKLREHGLF